MGFLNLVGSHNKRKRIKTLTYLCTLIATPPRNILLVSEVTAPASDIVTYIQIAMIHIFIFYAKVVY